MEEGVSADSSFYICLYSDLSLNDMLLHFLKCYEFYIGERILSELPENISLNENIYSGLKKIETDYYELIRPYFGRNRHHVDDGEYEAIGIAYFLEISELLRYLILDDKRARNFVERHFRILSHKLVGTVGFIRDCCCVDNKIDPENAIKILNNILSLIQQEKKRRPCGIDEKNKNLIMKIINQVQEVN